MRKRKLSDLALTVDNGLVDITLYNRKYVKSLIPYDCYDLGIRTKIVDNVLVYDGISHMMPRFLSHCTKSTMNFRTYRAKTKMVYYRSKYGLSLRAISM